MNPLTKRQRDILKLLMNRREYCSMNNIASKLNVSIRTIRYDLDYIENWLKDQGIVIERKPKCGIRICIDDYDLKTKRLIENELHNLELKILNCDERKFFILYYLLTLDNPITLMDLSYMLKVSKNTVILDMEEVEKEIKSNDILLVKKSGQGLSIEGNESSIRNFTFDLIQNGLRKQIFKLEQLFEDNSKADKSLLSNIIDYVEKSLEVTYSDFSKIEIILSLFVTFNRINKGNLIKKKDIMSFNEKKELKSILDILDEFFTNNNIDILENEKIYIAEKFLGAKINSNYNNYISIDEDKEIINLCEKIVKDAESQLGISLRDDIELFNSLIIHLKVAVYRLKNDQHISNPLIDQIKYRIPFIYEISKKIMKKHEDEIGKSIPDDEIGFIAMHLGAAFERSIQNGFMPKVLVVCGSGLATSSLLTTRLKIMLPELKLVGPISIKDLDETLEKNEIDFIISTVNIETSPIDVIVVNPLLDNEDLNKIKTLIFKNTSFKQLKYFSGRNCLNENKKICLKDLTKKEYIQLKVECSEWKEATIKSAEPLIKDGCISEKYLDSMIKAVIDLGPYMVFIPEIALVHASPKDGVNKECISIMTLKNYISFGDRNQERVKIIIAYAAKDNQTELLSNLIKILEKQDNIEKLKKVKSIDEVMNLCSY